MLCFKKGNLKSSTKWCKCVLTNCLIFSLKWKKRNLIWRASWMCVMNLKPKEWKNSLLKMRDCVKNWKRYDHFNPSLYFHQALVMVSICFFFFLMVDITLILPWQFYLTICGEEISNDQPKTKSGSCSASSLGCNFPLHQHWPSLTVIWDASCEVKYSIKLCFYWTIGSWQWREATNREE